MASYLGLREETDPATTSAEKIKVMLKTIALLLAWLLSIIQQCFSNPQCNIQ